MMIKIALSAVILPLVLSGCIFRDLSSDYQKASSIKPIEVPSNMSSTPREPLYPIPEVTVKDEAFYDIETDGFVVPRPEPMSSEREKAKVKIQSVGDQRWILAEAPTSQVWPLTQNFLSTYGIDVIERKPSTGLVETDWVEFKTDAKTQSQYKLFIEQGLRPATTEVHVLQRQMNTGAKAPEFWPKQSDSADRESWLLEELANSLAGNIDNKAASLLGQAVGGEVKAKLMIDGDEPELQLSLSMDRAWATVAHGLTKEGYVLWDENSDLGIFYVQYLGFREKQGWFARNFAASDGVIKDKMYSLAEVLGHLQETSESKELIGLMDGAVFSDPLPDTQGYLVVLKRVGPKVIVKIRTARGVLIPLKTNKHLLGVLSRNLI